MKLFQNHKNKIFKALKKIYAKNRHLKKVYEVKTHKKKNKLTPTPTFKEKLLNVQVMRLKIKKKALK